MPADDYGMLNQNAEMDWCLEERIPAETWARCHGCGEHRQIREMVGLENTRVSEEPGFYLYGRCCATE